MPSPRYWRQVPARYRLEGARCLECDHVVYPARTLCPACRSRSVEPVAISRSGRVVTSTVIHVPPDDLVDQAPYAMAIVETPEGARMMVQVVDCSPGEVGPGMEIDLEFRRIRQEGHSGILCYGHKAVPAGR